MGMKITKDHAYRMSLSGFVSMAAAVAIVWAFAEPVIIKSVSAEMTTTIISTVEQQIAPLNNAFVALLQRDINKVKKDIAALKYRQRSQSDWSASDASYLADLEIELEALNEAMKQLKGK